MADEKTGQPGAEDFLKNAIAAKKIRDELESFGTDELGKVVEIAKKLGYDFTEEDLKAALGAEWSAVDQPYVYRFCFSEPPVM